MGADEPGASTGVESERSSGPREFSLEQNYPNPFNPSTTIRYSVSQTGWASLRVFDVLGREIAMLLDEMKSPGTYQLVWNAKNAPSGVYFYKLNIGGMTETRTMQVVK